MNDQHRGFPISNEIDRIVAGSIVRSGNAKAIYVFLGLLFILCSVFPGRHTATFSVVPPPVLAHQPRMVEVPSSLPLGEIDLLGRVVHGLDVCKSNGEVRQIRSCQMDLTYRRLRHG